MRQRGARSREAATSAGRSERNSGLCCHPPAEPVCAKRREPEEPAYEQGVGDAAHPSAPNLGQGACQALEDAIVLAKCLAEQREPVAALRAYEARRMKRSAAIIEQSALVGTIGQWEQPLLCALRDGLTPFAFATFLPRLFVANLSIPS